MVKREIKTVNQQRQRIRHVNSEHVANSNVVSSSLCPMTNSSTVVGKNVNVVCQFWFMNLSRCSEVFHQGILKSNYFKFSNCNFERANTYIVLGHCDRI